MASHFHPHPLAWEDLEACHRAKPSSRAQKCDRFTGPRLIGTLVTTHDKYINVSQIPNPQLPKTFWWPLMPQGDKPLDVAKLEEEFSAEEAKELKTKKKEEVQY